MIEELLLQANAAGLSFRRRELEQRIEWSRLSRIDRLEGTLRKGRRSASAGRPPQTAVRLE